MNIDDWLPIYDEILLDFNYDRSEDERSAHYLADFISGREATGPSMIEEILSSQSVLIIGPSINDAPKIKSADYGAIICADDAMARCRELSILPDIIVTDLDSDILQIAKANRLGSLVVVHAHGDNMAALERWLPEFTGNIIGTCQCAPPAGLHNFGGFTDGDRSVLMAAHFKAASITLTGFDFQNPVPKEGKDPEVKLKKLKWAEKIISRVDVTFFNE